MTPRIASAERERRRQLPMDWPADLTQCEREQSETLPPRLAQYDRGARWSRWAQVAAFAIEGLVVALLGGALGLWLLWLWNGAPL